MAIGLGTGSTVLGLIEELAIRIKKGLRLTVVPTSAETASLAMKAGMIITELNETGRLALTIDGADEIDPGGRLIKGGGGALLSEKIVAASSDVLIIIADSSKLVSQLGRFPLPVEVIPFGYKLVMEEIMRSGFCKKVELRKKDDHPYITDHHHYILDCACEKIDDPGLMNTNLHTIPGVVETGLFINMATQAIVGYPDGKIETIKYK